MRHLPNYMNEWVQLVVSGLLCSKISGCSEKLLDTFSYLCKYFRQALILGFDWIELENP
jgi:hypothetical protein